MSFFGKICGNLLFTITKPSNLKIGFPFRLYNSTIFMQRDKRFQCNRIFQSIHNLVTWRISARKTGKNDSSVKFYLISVAHHRTCLRIYFMLNGMDHSNDFKMLYKHKQLKWNAWQIKNHLISISNYSTPHISN
jgi:hypothetical protein